MGINWKKDTYNTPLTEKSILQNSIVMESCLCEKCVCSHVQMCV